MKRLFHEFRNIALTYQFDLLKSKKETAETKKLEMKERLFVFDENGRLCTAKTEEGWKR